MTAEEDMNPTIELLKLLGSPFAPSANYTLSRIELTELYRCSKRNRMLFLYLDKIDKKNIDYFSAECERENIRRLKINAAIVRASQVLTDSNIKHAVFKTIRPYKSTTVDIDILVFGHGNYVESIKAMQKAGYKLVVHGPRSTTLWDQEANVGIDLYEEIAVSFITYIDKGKITQQIATRKLQNVGYVKTLTLEANLACIIAHSIIKEQMYTLSEYYTFLCYLEQIDIQKFIQVVKQNSLTTPTKAHAAITALLHKTAHKTVPEKLKQILAHLDKENIETTLLIKNDFETPHKYHMLTLARSMLEIMKVKNCRNSVVTQILHMLNPNFAKDFLKASMQHITRKRY